MLYKVAFSFLVEYRLDRDFAVLATSQKVIACKKIINLVSLRIESNSIAMTDPKTPGRYAAPFGGFFFIP